METTVSGGRGVRATHRPPERAEAVVDNRDQGFPSMLVIAFADYLTEEVEMYAQGLRAFGVRVVPVVGDVVADAAKTIANTPCDAVVTRILPAHFGIELIRALRGNPKTEHLPALVITSFPVPQLHEEARAAGATAVVLLPQTPEQLATAIRQLVRRTPAA